MPLAAIAFGLFKFDNIEGAGATEAMPAKASAPISASA